MPTIQDLLQGRTGNHVAPFLWVHGDESEEQLREELSRMHDVGVGAVCVEARPHRDFNGEGWWRDLGCILDECKRRGMGMWLLDDSHFPTGYANGEVKRNHPDLRKRFLRCITFDVMGPQEGSQLNLRYALTEPGVQVLGVVALPRQAGDQPTAAGAVDLTPSLHARDDYMTGRPACDAMGRSLGFDEGPCPVVDLNLSEGPWYVCVLTVGFGGGERETEGYLNPIDPKATQVLIDTVYQPVFDHFGADFGGTFRGFFSDEPRLGNIHGSEGASIGRNPAMPLPWRTGLEGLLAEALEGTCLAGLSGRDLVAHLPLLFFGDCEEAHVLRCAYMDLVSRLYSDCFDGVIADWCHAHGVEHIGHTIEDNHAVARLGYGTGHFFRAMAHADMAGVDVVMQQLVPGYDDGLFRAAHRPGWEAGFFDHCLGRLGGSLAHLDASKRGRCMAEVFGAYGWGEGNRLCKWQLDHMLVRGVNEFVPHAFSPKAFPDPDCPPHFWAQGHNPQYRDFDLVMAYANRLGCLLSGGRYGAPVAVWFDAEGEWSGAWQALEEPAAALDRAQVEFDFVPSDYLDTGVAEGDGTVLMGAERFRAVVVPRCEAMPLATLEALDRLARAGVRVWFVDGLPARCCEGEDAGTLLARLGMVCAVVPLEGLAAAVVAAGLRELEPSTPQPWLRTYHYQRPEEGADVYLLVNEGPADRVRCSLSGAAEGITYTYDPFKNSLVVDGDAFSLDIPAYGSKVVMVSRAPIAGALVAPDDFVPGARLALGACSLSLAPMEACCREWGKAISLQAPAWISSLPGQESFGGLARYDFDMDLSPSQAADVAVHGARLELVGAHEGISVLANGRPCGRRIVGDWWFDVTDALHAGTNHLRVEATTTLGRTMDDFVGQYLPLEPTGISGATLVIGR